jgi:hypothetical protein
VQAAPALDGDDGARAEAIDDDALAVRNLL